MTPWLQQTFGLPALSGCTNVDPATEVQSHRRRLGGRYIVPLWLTRGSTVRVSGFDASLLGWVQVAFAHKLSRVTVVCSMYTNRVGLKKLIGPSNETQQYMMCLRSIRLVN